MGDSTSENRGATRVSDEAARSFREANRLMRALTAARDWLDDRTGYRAAMAHVLEEPLPRGVGWCFTLGALLLLLLAVQAVTGVVLMMYYVPSPDAAWDSVRFVIDRVQFGRIVRNLHAFGASVIVVVGAAHLLRVFFFGSYKRPREVTWISGVLLLLVILAFALTGYLLPWDQRAYWATVVTLNIARSAPVAGEFVASLMRGGAELGALTLARWYAVHVAVLPLLLLALVTAHLVLMRRHGISGPLRPKPGPARPFFPYHAVRDATVGIAVFCALLWVSTARNAPFERVADPTDATYVPRPEWYFLWLFELLKYFPGPLEVIAAHGVPAILVGLLLLLPFLDRSPERRPWKRPLAVVAALLITGGVAALTLLGLRDAPAAEPDTPIWGAQAMGGELIASQPTCTSCHRPGGSAPAWSRLRLRRDESWIRAHSHAPNQLVPEIPADLDPIAAQRIHAVGLWTRALLRGAPRPERAGPHQRALALIGANCLGCHVLDGEGHRFKNSPPLARAGRDHDARWLAGWIADPVAYEYDTDMPPFGEKLPRDDIETIAAYLATRK
jgi:ubiquinol-cytochrome c reductase cytochrome b subunit